MRLRGGHNLRLLLMAAVLVAATLYVALAAALDMQVSSGEQVYGVAVDTPGRLDLHLEVFEIDATRLTATVHVTISPVGSLRGTRQGSPARDMMLVVSVDRNVQDIILPANERIASTDMRVPLETGSILRYPFDHYANKMRWRAFEGTPAAPGVEIPLRLYNFESSPDFDVLTDQVGGSSEGDVTLALNATRPLVIKWFAGAIYFAMLAVATSAVTVGGMLFTRTKQLESALISALCAMMFSMPIMRNILPGSPPLGIAADLLIFLWAELAVVCGLTMGVSTWIRDGLAPPAPRTPSEQPLA